MMAEHQTRFKSYSVAFTILILLLQCPGCNARPNFLLIVCDDLGPYVSPYISEDHPMHGKTPNIQRLVDNGDTFLFTDVQLSVCGPSRASFLTGRYPDTTKIFNFERYIFQISEKMLTIPKYFKERLGYYTAAFGKVFHPYYKGNDDLYYERGHWSQPTKAFDKGGNSECYGREFYCPKNAGSLTDAKIAKEFEKFIDERAKDRSRPWLSFVGFRRPHDSWAAPGSSFNEFPISDIQESDFYDETKPDIDDLEFRNTLAYYECRKINDKKIYVSGRSKKQPLNLTSIHEDKFAINKIRAAYYASVHWVDTRVGVLLDKLEKEGFHDNTVIVFFGDHGYQMGEKGMWCKNTLYEGAVRTPLIISVPELPQASIHKSPTQLIDIFPTLVDLAGESSENFNDNSGYNLDGVSLKPLLFDEAQTHHVASYSQYPRCVCNAEKLSKEGRSCPAESDYSSSTLTYEPKNIQFHPCAADQMQFDRDSCHRPKIVWMGYSIRTSHWKYVEWRQFKEVRNSCTVGYFEEPTAELDHTRSETDWNTAPIETELYDMSGVYHFNEPGTETNNLARNSKYSEVVRELSSMIKQKYMSFRTICGNHGIEKRNGSCVCAEGWKGKNCEIMIQGSTNPQSFNEWFKKMIKPGSPGPSPKPTEYAREEISSFNAKETKCTVYGLDYKIHPDLLDKRPNCKTKDYLYVSKAFKRRNWKQICLSLCLKWNKAQSASETTLCKAIASINFNKKVKCALLPCSPDQSKELFQMEQSSNPTLFGWIQSDCLLPEVIEKLPSPPPVQFQKSIQLNNDCTVKIGYRNNKVDCLGSHILFNKRIRVQRNKIDNAISLCASECLRTNGCKAFNYKKVGSKLLCQGVACDTGSFDFGTKSLKMWYFGVLGSGCAAK